MNTTSLALVAVSALIPVTLVAAPATAATPTGTCTQSYAAYTYDQLLAIDPAVQSIFSVVDTNGDGIVCFKYYPNGPHAGHGGNLVDNKAAPHT